MAVVLALLDFAAPSPPAAVQHPVTGRILPPPREAFLIPVLRCIHCWEQGVSTDIHSPWPHAAAFIPLKYQASQCKGLFFSPEEAAAVAAGSHTRPPFC